MITKTRIGNHLRRHALGDQPTFRQGFKEGVAFAQKHAESVQQDQVPKHLYDAACRRADKWEKLAEDAYSAPVQQDVNKQLLDALRWALEWIDAVPKGTVLPTMPGFDRDYVDTLISIAGKK